MGKLWSVVLGVALFAAQGQGCGERKVDYAKLILGGEDAISGQWPWHAAIFHRIERTFLYQCGGAIINQNTILTAAHCVQLNNGVITVDRLSVQVGRTYLYAAESHTQEHQADRIIVHEEYSAALVRHDIALIKLATDIKFTDYVQPVCLWERSKVDIGVLVGRVGSVVGFGITEVGEVADRLRVAYMPIVDFQTCLESNRNLFGRVLTRNVYCAGFRNGTTVCGGDSGGGMYFEIENRWYIRGIVSFSGQNCQSADFAGFSDVATYLDWINRYTSGTPNSPYSATVIDKQQLLSLDICGVNNYPGTAEDGKPVFQGYPWLGVIEYQQISTGQRRLLCQGTLITRRYVLTAAQCVSLPANSYRLAGVRLGEFDTGYDPDCGIVEGRRECQPPVQTVPVEQIIVHSGFNNPAFANDLALLRLRQQANVDQDNIKPICLPFSTALKSHKPSYYIRTGWLARSSSTVLYRSFPSSIESVGCQDAYNDQDVPLEKTYGQICIRRDNPSTGVCTFNMAATPLQSVQVVGPSERYVLYGLLSFGPKQCLETYPDVYTAVAPYVDWIVSNLKP
ncbi:CLIP domain-containing serine protease B15-like [Anopheles stephensi]|uniref:CLIP domain-containing serine protease B15-like n=1 Tax=Anopheles stephensi TaxID=30069 RepID=UPI001658B623|nr:CLIP domain-containing serine protease B15-like [Anopheles stephensi]